MSAPGETDVQGAVPPSVSPAESGPISRRRTLPLAAGAALVVAGLGIGGWFLATRSGDEDGAGAEAGGESSEAACAALERLAGRWVFATEVTAAGTLGSSGLRGDYELEVDVAGCAGTARLAKTGYTARKFSDREVQRGESDLVPGEGDAAFGHSATVELRSAAGKGPDMELVFAATDEGRLVGTWRQRGERWDRTRLSGFLDGRREDATGDFAPALRDQPCAVKCAVGCDAAGRDVPAAAFAACTIACEAASTEVPACGDTTPLPPAHDLALTGPHPSLDAACEAALSGATCDKSPKMGKQRTPSIGRKRLDGWLEARTVVLGDGDDARVRLGLETEAGWFLSAPLDAMPASTGLPLTDVRLHARHLSEGQGRRYVLGEVVLGRDTDVVESLFACAPGTPPHCVLVPTRQRIGGEERVRLEVVPLPGSVLAVTADDPAQAAGLAPGVYAW